MLAHSDLGWSNGFHFARMPDPDVMKGWVLLSTYVSDYDTDDWGENQLIMLEVVDKDLLTPTVWRLGHTWNYNTVYYDEGIAVMGDNGQELWWNANWFGTDIETYHMPLPTAWWTEIGSESNTVATTWFIIGN